MILATAQRAELTLLVRLNFIHLIFATVSLIYCIKQWSAAYTFHTALLVVMIILFMATQIAAIGCARKKKSLNLSSSLGIWPLPLLIIFLPMILSGVLPLCFLFLIGLPLSVAGTRQFNRLPPVLFVTFLAAAVTVLVDLANPAPHLRFQPNLQELQLVSSLFFTVYLTSLLINYFIPPNNKEEFKRGRINVATQYALVITCISATSIGLMTGVMINQTRKSQMQQVGNNFQTVAENFAQLASSHLEQQIQKLQLLSQQLPILRQELIASNSQYGDEGKTAKMILDQKNMLWQGSFRDESFRMNYLNSPVLQALSRFRGHNSFHDDILLVDRYGGLVASLGKKPEKFFFYDTQWWQLASNGGLGNIFIGDQTIKEGTITPKVRLAVDIIDHSTNKLIGILSSYYVLRTLNDDMVSFIPESVDQISLVDASGKVITSTAKDITDNFIWTFFDGANTTMKPKGSGWILGQDHHETAALLGYSDVSTAYNVLSDPLQRLGWMVVVSGTRADALSGVNTATKMVLIVGLLAIAAGVLAAIAAARVITRPIENLTTTASELAHGNLEHRAKIEGPEEIVALSTGFNQLTDRLHEVIRNLKSQTNQLAKAKGEAETATKLKGEFLAKMSHEIRTPLNAILGFADLLHDSIEDVQSKRHAEIIKNSGTDLLDLINDILDISKIEAGQMELQIQPIDLRTLFAELERIFSVSAQEKNVRIELQVYHTVPTYLMMDKIRLRQVLFNLIGNALKFTDQGHVRCMAKAVQNLEENAWDLIIEVSDTGVGVDPIDIEEIFKIFKQRRTPSDSYIEGTGLGLAISKNLVEMMGGHIEAHREMERGACFSIHLPRLKAALPEAVETKEPYVELAVEEEIIFKEASVLIVDDLEVNRHLIIEVLQGTPLSIKQAASGKEALELAGNHSFDLVLLDIRMPDIDGYQTLERLHMETNLTSIPIIALTAAGMKDDISRIQQAGFTDYLIRPFGKKALLDLLKNYLPFENNIQQVDRTVSTAANLHFNLNEESPWHCPKEAEDYLVTTFKMRLDSVLEHQSMPEIIDFAKDIERTGALHKIDILVRYGKELQDHAEAFDIQNVEKMLAMYNPLLDRRVKHQATVQPLVSH